MPSSVLLRRLGVCRSTRVSLFQESVRARALTHMEHRSCAQQDWHRPHTLGDPRWQDGYQRTPASRSTTTYRCRVRWSSMLGP